MTQETLNLIAARVEDLEINTDLNYKEVFTAICNEFGLDMDYYANELGSEYDCECLIGYLAAEHDLNLMTAF